jgi:uncharacterized protein (TIGR00251 family)
LGNQTKLTLHVAPNASRNELLGFTEGILRVRVAASPVRGKANRELIVFLSRQLEISRDRLTITRGQTGRYKTIAITGLSRQQVLERLSQD